MSIPVAATSAPVPLAIQGTAGIALVGHQFPHETICLLTLASDYREEIVNLV